MTPKPIDHQIHIHVSVCPTVSRSSPQMIASINCIESTSGPRWKKDLEGSTRWVDSWSLYMNLSIIDLKARRNTSILLYGGPRPLGRSWGGCWFPWTLGHIYRLKQLPEGIPFIPTVFEPHRTKIPGLSGVGNEEVNVDQAGEIVGGLGDRTQWCRKSKSTTARPRMPRGHNAQEAARPANPCGSVGRRDSFVDMLRKS
jgi:hypothetical protein